MSAEYEGEQTDERPRPETIPMTTAEATTRRWSRTESHSTSRPSGEASNSSTSSTARSSDTRIARRCAGRRRSRSARRASADEGGWISRTYRETWDWVTELSLGLRDLGLGAGAGGRASSVAPGRSRSSATLRRSQPARHGADLPAVGAGPGGLHHQQRRRHRRLRRERPAGGEDRGASVPRSHAPARGHHGCRGQVPRRHADLRRRHGARRLDPAARRLWREGWESIDGDQVATVIHTSGTTANPKGAMLSHGEHPVQLPGAHQVIDLSEEDRSSRGCRCRTSSSAWRASSCRSASGRRSPTPSRSSSAWRRTWPT